MSLANALLLVFTLLWVVMGIIEFRRLKASYKKIKKYLNKGKINKDEYITNIRRQKVYFMVNISYLVTVICQLGYVIFNWDEVNV